MVKRENKNLKIKLSKDSEQINHNRAKISSLTLWFTLEFSRMFLSLYSQYKRQNSLSFHIWISTRKDIRICENLNLKTKGN